MFRDPLIANSPFFQYVGMQDTIPRNLMKGRMLRTLIQVSLSTMPRVLSYTKKGR